MITRILMTLLLTSTISFATPKPFGLEIGKTSYVEAKKKFKDIVLVGDMFNNNYIVYTTKASTLDFPGIHSLTLIFNKSNKLVSIEGFLHKKRLTDIKKILIQKYNLILDNSSEHGEFQWELRDKNLNITLSSSPHLDDLNLIYAEKDFYNETKKHRYKKDNELL